MSTRKISANVPSDLLRKACKVADLNQTEAIVAGLKELIAVHRRTGLLRLKGKIDVDYSSDHDRQRIRL